MKNIEILYSKYPFRMGSSYERAYCPNEVLFYIRSHLQNSFRLYFDANRASVDFMYKVHRDNAMHPAGGTNAAISSWLPQLRNLR